MQERPHFFISKTIFKLFKQEIGYKKLLFGFPNQIKFYFLSQLNQNIFSNIKNVNNLRMNLGEVLETAPTTSFNTEVVVHNQMKMQVKLKISLI